MALNERIRVLIAGVGGGSYGLEILKALRLSDLPYAIIGCDMTKPNMGFTRADKSYVLPPANSSRYISALESICVHEEIDVLFPGSEPDLGSISDSRKVFQDMGILVPINSKELIDLCLNKKETFLFLDQNNIPAPKSLAIESSDDIASINFFPVVIKPYLGGGGSNNTFIAQDYEEVSFFCHYILKYGGKPLVQQYVGSHENEYTVGVLSGKDRQPLSVIGIKRDLLNGLSNRIKIKSLYQEEEILTISSGISQGRVVIDQKLNNQCIKIAKVLGSEGPINIQCRVVEGTAYPFEINPRFSGTTYMRALAGVNEPDLYIRRQLLQETHHPTRPPENGYVLRGLEEAFVKE